MKFAVARAGQWFFGVVIAYAILMSWAAIDEENAAWIREEWRNVALGGLVIATVIAGVIFFSTWRAVEEYKLEKEFGPPPDKDTAQ